MTKGKTRHGGPYDRGTCDSYYRRGHTPHYFTGETGFSDRIEMKDMSEQQIKEYNEGYENNEERGDFKDWGEDREYDDNHEDEY